MPYNSFYFSHYFEFDTPFRAKTFLVEVHIIVWSLQVEGHSYLNASTHKLELQEYRIFEF